MTSIRSLRPASKVAVYAGVYAISCVIIGFLGAYGLAYVVAAFALLIVPLAPIYVIFVLVLTLYKRRKEAVISQSRTEEDRQRLTQHPAFRFNNESQIHTLVHNIILTVAGIILLAFTFFFVGEVRYANPGIHFGINMSPELTLGFNTVMILLTVTCIVVNVGIVYNQQIRAVEQHATRTRTGAWKLILVNRIWSWGVWSTGGLVAVYIIYQRIGYLP